MSEKNARPDDDTAGDAGAKRTAPQGALTAPYVLEYTYRRSVGPVVGRFLTALREGRIEGVKTASGKVLVPPTEYDPETGDAVGEPVAVGSAGVVVSWAWVGQPRPNQPLDKPFAWALVKLDGADTAMLHAVSAASEAEMKSGMRVKAKWRAERVGEIRDIVCFEADDGASAPRGAGRSTPGAGSEASR